MRKLKVTLNRNGMSMEVMGVQGPSCDNIIEEVLTKIGGIVKDSTEKPEYYEQESQNDLRYGTDYSSN